MNSEFQVNHNCKLSKLQTTLLINYYRLYKQYLLNQPEISKKKKKYDTKNRKLKKQHKRKF